MKKIHYNAVFILLLISTLIFIYCLGVAVPDKTLLPLNPQDSLAVRAILDSNGLGYIDLGDYDDRKRVLVQHNSFVVWLKLDTFNLDTFRFVEEFDLLDSLNVIKLNNNKLTYIQVDDTVTLDSFATIHLSYNNLDVIPVTFLMINNVKFLSLNNNNLTSLPLEIIKINYNIFQIRYNKLTNVPDTLKAWLSQYDPEWEKYQSK